MDATARARPDATARSEHASARDDGALLLEVQAGDAFAFDRLYERFSGQAHGLAWRMSHDHARAEEIVQEAFLSIWRCRATFRPDRGSPAAWVMTIVRNRALDARRRDVRHEADGAGDARREPPVRDRIEEGVIERDEAARLRATLATLPSAQRDVVTLAYFGQLTCSEIATTLDVPIGTIKGRMRIALAKLRAQVPA